MAYFSRKTHLQVECSLIAPPSSGPKILDMAKTDEIIAIYLAYREGGTTTETMTPVMEYIPDPPTPCKALNIMLAR